jgi:hypothetical protein
MLSLRGILREAYMRVGGVSVPLHARSFGTEVPQDDAGLGLCSNSGVTRDAGATYFTP